MWARCARGRRRRIFRRLGLAARRVRFPAPSRDRALDLDPDSTRAYNERGQIYLENGDTRKAIQEFSRSLQVTSTIEGHYQRGAAYEKLGDHQNAIADFDAAIRESRDAPYAYRARSAARRASGDREGAAADEQKARSIETGQDVSNSH